jgi:hypothetical protein
MNTVIRRDYIDRLVCRSFLESSLAHMGVPPKPLVSAISFRTTHAHIDLHQLKLKLLKSALETTSNAGLFKRLCGAANQAADLAWATSSPLHCRPTAGAKRL